MRRSLMIFVAGGLAALMLIGGAFAFWYERPATLRVAVSRMDTDDFGLVTAVAAELKRERKPVRLRLTPTDSSADASAAIDAGTADLAVVRTDIALPDDAQTVVILHRDTAIMVAPGSAEVHDVADLVGHRVGIIRNGPGNSRLLETILAQYEIKPEAVSVEALQPEEVAEALRGKRVDAVMAVDVVSSPMIREVVKAVAAAGEGPPSFIPVAEADAIAQRSPAYESSEIVRGAFGGSPPRPSDEFDTLSVTHRLVATESVDQGAIADLTRFLLSERAALATHAPLARRIEAPSTDKGSALPVHAGAAAYIDDEEQTFFDKYSDMIYMLAMLVGVLASGATAVLSRMNAKHTAALDASVGQLTDMLALIRTAPSAAVLDGLQAEADGIFASALDLSGPAADEGRLRVFGLALDQVRSAIRDRRDVLASFSPISTDGSPRYPGTAAAE